MEETHGLQDYSDNQPVMVVDPVCGARLYEAKATEKTGYAGEMYYFCSADCRIKFEEDPGHFIGQRE